MATFVTGADDLRGGNDNVHLVLLLRNGRTHRFDNVNNRRKWEDVASITVRLPLPAGMTHAQISGVRIETTFGGGIGGDNWNLQSLSLGTQEGGTRHNLFYADGAPLQRFTGDTRMRTWTF